MTSMKEIYGDPTRYGGIQFRSRLEARWAAMFDLLDWRWSYEPCELSGYVPAFIIEFIRPLLVEVVPLLWTTDAVEPCLEAIAKVENSGWRDESLLVGAELPIHFKLPGLLTLRRGHIGIGLYSLFKTPLSILRCWACGGATPLSSDDQNFGQNLDESRKFKPIGSRCCGYVRDMREAARAQTPEETARHVLRAMPGVVEPLNVRSLWREAGDRVQWQTPPQSASLPGST